MTDLFRGNDKSVTVHNKRSKIPPSKSVHFVTLVRKFACCSSQLVFTSLYACSSVQYASEQYAWCILLPFVNFALRVAPQTKS